MTTLEKYQDEVRKQIAQGLDFSESVFGISLSTKSYLAERAKVYGYRKPKTSYFALGGSFYLLLQKVYNTMKKKGML
jgi:hypothetical protein